MQKSTPTLISIGVLCLCLEAAYSKPLAFLNILNSGLWEALIKYIRAQLSNKKQVLYAQTCLRKSLELFSD